MSAYNRRGLEGMIDAYLEALAARDPSRLKVTRDVFFSENYQPLKLGEGTWATITRVGTYKHYFADPEAGTAGFIGTVRENGGGALFDIRLKLDGDLISEIETFIIRDALSCARYEELGAPEAVWLEAVPPPQRISRAKLIATVDKYFQSMQRNDGKGDYSFFDPECERIEHALQTTNVKKPQAYGHSEDTDFSSMTAEQQWKTGFLGFVTEIRDRRFVVVDEERQVVFTIVTLDHNGTIRDIPLSTGKTFHVPPYFDVPRTLNVMEAFKLRGEKLYRIEMTLTELPYGTRPPTREARPRRSIAAASIATPGLLDRVLGALKAHDSSTLPLSANARYTENGSDLKIGDGLWGTLTGLAPGYRIDIVDGGEALALCGIVEESTPGILALRLKMDGAAIAEIEAVVIRKEEMGERGGTVTLFQPRLITELDPAGFTRLDTSLLASPGRASSRGELIAIADRYFDGIEQASSRNVPFAEGCTRRDNGVVTVNDMNASPLDPAVPGYRPFALDCAAQIDSGYFRRISKIRERHHIVDAARGLVLTIAVFDNPGHIKTVDVSGVGKVNLPGLGRADASAGPADQAFATRRGINVVVPTSELTVQLTKIRDGKIAHIETLSRGGPYGMTSGWTE